MVKLSFVLFFLFITYTVAGQSLSGVIEDIDSKNPVPVAMVTNKTSGNSTFADIDGNYSIAAKAGDIIEFSYLGYYPVTITTPTAINNSGYKRIGMKKQLVSLENVEIRPDLTPYQIDSIARRKTYRQALDRLKERSFMSPASALAENISKKSKQRWRFQKNFARWEDQKFVDTRYTPELVKEMTGIEDEQLFHFMNAYPMPADYARTASDLEIKMWIKYNYRQWQKTPRKNTQHPDSLNFGPAKALPDTAH